ncbi:lysyl-tRNA synthetase [Mycolicibacterium fortuitum]|uniref:Lysyl-tRNA synthetase n=1 Tax=Mycolicibacterium fortuitum TaxID=1766 RepID=A0A378UWZ1_MYCFO|nr:lysyl-tRNA synthetase [Mycolicibacterium fortuitum]
MSPADRDDASQSQADLPEQFRIRQAKRERLLAEGREPYPVTVPRTHTLAELRNAYPTWPPTPRPG